MHVLDESIELPQLLPSFHQRGKERATFDLRTNKEQQNVSFISCFPLFFGFLNFLFLPFPFITLFFPCSSSFRSLSHGKMSIYFLPSNSSCNNFREGGGRARTYLSPVIVTSTLLQKGLLFILPSHLFNFLHPFPSFPPEEGMEAKKGGYVMKKRRRKLVLHCNSNVNRRRCFWIYLINLMMY